jgi:hypothetical protein
MMQAEAQGWADAFNKRRPPKEVQFLTGSSHPRTPPHRHLSPRTPASPHPMRFRRSIRLRAHRPPRQTHLQHREVRCRPPPHALNHGHRLPSTSFIAATHRCCRYVQGDYVKYSNNDGWSEDRRNTPHAFSHFTYEASGRSLVVCDIQGTSSILLLQVIVLVPQRNRPRCRRPLHRPSNPHHRRAWHGPRQQRCQGHPALGRLSPLQRHLPPAQAAASWGRRQAR